MSEPAPPVFADKARSVDVAIALIKAIGSASSKLVPGTGPPMSALLEFADGGDPERLREEVAALLDAAKRTLDAIGAHRHEYTQRARDRAKALAGEAEGILQDALAAPDELNRHNLFYMIKPAFRELCTIASALGKEFGALAATLASAYVSLADEPKTDGQLRALTECVGLAQKEELTEADLDWCNDRLEDAGIDLDLVACSESARYVIEVRKKADGD